MQKLKTIAVAFLFLFSLLFVVFNVSQVHAAGSTYYVATTGSDTAGDGSIGNPYKTLRKAINASSNSDTIYMRGGDYTTGFDSYGTILINRSGTKANPFTIQNYNNEKVTIDGKLRTITVGYGMFRPWSGANYYNNISIIGLNFSNCSRDAFRAGGSATGACEDIKIIDCSYYNISKFAIVFYTGHSDNYYFENITVSDCSFEKIEVNYVTSEAVGFFGCKNWIFANNTCGWAKSIFFDTGEGSVNGLIENNNFHLNNSGSAIKLDAASYGTQTISNVTIRDNVIWGIQITGAPGSYGIWINPEIAGGNINNISIYNNIINLSRQDTSECQHGIGITTVANTVIDNVTIKYNTVYLQNPVGSTTNSRCIHVYQGTGLIKGCVLANNILMNKNAMWCLRFTDLANTTTKVLRYNNLYNGMSGTSWTGYYTDGQNKTESTAIKASPQVVNVNAGNFHLNSTSPAIDAATSTYTVSTDYDGNLRPMGLGYDIGAYEVGPSSIIITSDSGFNISNGVRYGSGTTASPYMISNWTVYNVSVSGTTKNFTIRDCTIIHHAIISGLSATSNLLWYNVIMDGAGHIPLSYIYLTHTLTTFTNSKFYNLSYSYMKNG